METMQCGNFEIRVDESSFAFVKNGVQWLKLPVVSCVDADGKQDQDLFGLHLQTREEDAKRVFTWTTASSLWMKKQYVLEVRSDCVLYFIHVEGAGTLDRIRYFTDWKKVEYEIGAYLLPVVNDTNKSGNMKTVVESSEIDIWRAAPPMFVFPFSVEDEPGTLGIGLVAESGNYHFDVFQYACPFQFTLPLYGKTRVSGSWNSQAIWCAGSASEEDTLRDYSNWHFENGYASRHSGEIYKWWAEPTFCGWGEQRSYMHLPECGGANALQRNACRQVFYEKMMRKLEDERLHAGSVIIDSKWQKAFGLWEVNEDWWPDLRGFVDEMHRKGTKVMLWIKAWDADGLPGDECIQLDCNPVAADPTNPKYVARMKAYIRRLLSPEEGCYDCDGFKVDFFNCFPRGYAVQTHSGEYGVELMHTWLKIMYETAKEIKPDALISNFSAHPYFTQFVDRTRCHDYRDDMRSIRSVMAYRSDIYEAANPDVPMDMDAGGTGSVRDFHRCMDFQLERGVPSLYWLTASGDPLEHVPFDQDDYDCIRHCWHTYQQRLDADWARRKHD